MRALGGARAAVRWARQHRCTRPESHLRAVGCSGRARRRERRGLADGGSRSTPPRAAPSGLRPYAELMRLDRPIGSWLLFLPCSWGLALATAPHGWPPLNLLALCGVGAVVMRGAGCTVNDMWDADLDRKVERTASRPLASGAMSHRQAAGFLAGQLSVGLGVLCCFNPYTIVLAASSLGLVVVYPLMKRVTDWPQAVLGLVFNWGVLVGWAGVHGSLDPWAVAPMYTAAVSWTLIYDTIYAHQDKKDDVAAGVRSTALRLQGATKPWLAGFAGVMATGLVLSGVSTAQEWPYYVGVGAAMAHVGRQIHTVNLDDPRDCLAHFKSNRDTGLLVLAGLLGSSAVETLL